MKKLATIILIGFVCYNFSNCAGGKDILLEKEPPFKVKAAFYQNWVAGTKEGGSGTHVSIILGAISEEIKVKEIFYLDKVAEAVQDRQNIDKYTGFFTNDLKEDVIMDINVIKESTNLPKEKSLFNLKKNEAIISYFHQEEINYFRIENLEEKPLIAYPGTRPNGID